MLCSKTGFTDTNVPDQSGKCIIVTWSQYRHWIRSCKRAGSEGSASAARLPRPGEGESRHGPDLTEGPRS